MNAQTYYKSPLEPQVNGDLEAQEILFPYSFGHFSSPSFSQFRNLSSAMQHYMCLLGLALPALVNGFALFDRSPVALEARRQRVGCTKNILVNLVASITANQPGGGASFCLSVLGISTKTVTLTSTTSVSTAATVLTAHRGTVTAKPTTITSTLTQ
jgi:hypothetical protein